MTMISSPSFAHCVPNRCNNGAGFSFARAVPLRHTPETACSKNSLCSSLPVNKAEGTSLALLPACGQLAHKLKTGSVSSVSSTGI